LPAPNQRVQPANGAAAPFRQHGSAPQACFLAARGGIVALSTQYYCGAASISVRFLPEKLIFTAKIAFPCRSFGLKKMGRASYRAAQV
jgi:hypothetical protein